MRVALILAGGMGTRLKPITKTLNKSLIPLNSRPLLLQIISQFQKNEVDQILVLSGYLSVQIENIIKSRYSLMERNVIVLPSAPQLSPAERLLDSHILWQDADEVIITYCDNLILDSDLNDHLNFSRQSRAIVCLRERGNTQITSKGNIRYSEMRSELNPYVELGYWVLKPKILLGELSCTTDLPKALKNITNQIDIHPTIVTEYKSISNMEKFNSLRSGLRKTLFLDRDGIINKNPKKGSYVTKKEEIDYLHSNLDCLSKLSIDCNVDYIVITNQAGIERQMITELQLDTIHQEMSVYLLDRGIPILAFYYCPHHWESGCICRKPKSGMILKALVDFELNVDDCAMLGDTDSDLAAGQAAGIKSFKLKEGADDEIRTSVFNNIRRTLNP